jgi:hypothetical protein
MSNTTDSAAAKASASAQQLTSMLGRCGVLLKLKFRVVEPIELLEPALQLFLSHGMVHHWSEATTLNKTKTIISATSPEAGLLKQQNLRLPQTPACAEHSSSQ